MGALGLAGGFCLGQRGTGGGRERRDSGARLLLFLWVAFISGLLLFLWFAFILVCFYFLGLLLFRLAFSSLVYILQLKEVSASTKSLSVLLWHCNNVMSLSMHYQTLNVLRINNNSKGFSFLTRIRADHRCFHSHSTLASSHSASRYIPPAHPCSRCPVPSGCWLRALLPGKIPP